jgi:hypothetical protein
MDTVPSELILRVSAFRTNSLLENKEKACSVQLSEKVTCSASAKLQEQIEAASINSLNFSCI